MLNVPLLVSLKINLSGMANHGNKSISQLALNIAEIISQMNPRAISK